MAKTNTAKHEERITHGGAKAQNHLKPLIELERAVATCLLWENAFYESGNSIAKRIAALCKEVKPEEIAALAIRARKEFHLRHVPLFLCVQLAAIASKRNDGLVRTTIFEVVNRPDEMGELLSIYWKQNGANKPIAAQVKKGLADCFHKFAEYNFAKWNQDAAVKLRDVMFLVHPKMGDKELGKRIASNTLATPDTWEVSLSAGKDKKATWERLLSDKKLGYGALLKNLRNMVNVGVERKLVKEALLAGAERSKELPFRFVAAAKHAPAFEDALGEAMVKALKNQAKLPGKTIFVIDISGSMRASLSSNSEMNRIDAACALAMLIREVCEEAVIYATAGNDASRVHATAQVPPRYAFALRDAIHAQEEKLGGGGIFLTQCMEFIAGQEKMQAQPDRVLVLTDEQDCDTKLSPSKSKLLGRHNYILNVAQYNRAIGFDRWTTISGWSEQVLDWIRFEEQNSLAGDGAQEILQK